MATEKIAKGSGEKKMSQDESFDEETYQKVFGAPSIYARKYSEQDLEEMALVVRSFMSSYGFARRLVSYGTISKVLSPWSKIEGRPLDRLTRGRVLGTLARMDYADGRRLTSARVVRDGETDPSEGFWGVVDADELDLFKSEADFLRFHQGKLDTTEVVVF